MGGKPDLIILGQITLDHVVPAEPGPWTIQVGGNALFAAAGARLWLDPARIGLVFRRGTGFPIDVEAMLEQAGINHVRRRDIDVPHLTEWIIYERDGSRRCLPRNDGLREIGSEGANADINLYLDYLLQFSPEARDIPDSWLPARAALLAPQVGTRQSDSLSYLKNRSELIYVDPSPYVTKHKDVSAIGAVLEGATGILPSELEIGHLVKCGWSQVAAELQGAGFSEVVLKRGPAPVLLATRDAIEEIPVPPAAVVDPTGAGDSFCGAYVACRLSGFSPPEAIRRAIVTAGMVVETEGADAALRLDPGDAENRLAKSTAQ